VHPRIIEGLLGIFIFSTLGCRVHHDPVESPSSPSITSGRELLRSKRTDCFGTCPAYELVLFESGHLRYEGFSYVKNAGPVEVRVGPSAIATIRSNLERMSTLATDCCNCNDMTDMPSVDMTFSGVGGRMKRIDHYYGCEKAPDWLYDVENSIEAALETERWVGQKAQYKAYHPR
jgi:hypothetical protein